jgi:hypothetical protein
VAEVIQTVCGELIDWTAAILDCPVTSIKILCSKSKQKELRETAKG